MPKVICLLLPLLLMIVLFWNGEEVKALPENAGEVDVSVSNERGALEEDGGIRSERVSVRTLMGRLDERLLVGLDDGDRKMLAEYLDVLTRAEGGRVSWCWSEETSEAKVAAFVEAERIAVALGGGGGGVTPLANQFLSGGRWDETATDGVAASGQGNPTVVTWSLVPDGTLVPGTSGSPDGGSDVRVWLAGIYGGSVNGGIEEQPWFVLFEEAFELMGETCGVEFRYEANDDGATMGSLADGVIGVRGDIRIGSRFLDGGGGLLGISLGPDDGDMVLDSGDGGFNLTGGNSVRLVNTLTHELGHCLGLDHVCPVNGTKLMEPNLTTSFRGPQFDEFQSLQRLYGDDLEFHGEVRDNDSAEAANLLQLEEGEELSILRLSIDDNRDEDFFAVDVLNGHRLQATVVPGEGSYLEGEEASFGCSGGVLFDSRLVHDLRVVIVDRDGETVLAEADAFGPGETEETGLFEFPRSGRYFVRVAGGPTNAAQLYELRLNLEERLPGPRLVLGEGLVVAESGVVKNGKTDANETVKVRFPLANEGITAADGLSVSVTGSAVVTVFEQMVSDGLVAGEVGFVEVVFGGIGVCGDEAVIDIVVEDGSGVLVMESVVIGLGEDLPPISVEANFEGGTMLPQDWASAPSGSGNEWTAVSSRSDSPIRSAFASGTSSPGEAVLLSPSFELGSDGGTLSFRHSYDIERGYDGGVLEVSRDGGEWRDLIADFGLEVTGGYNRTIRGTFGSAIAGQSAWSGELGQFGSVVVGLPASWAGEVLQFRWRLVSDESGASVGWWVDTVKVEIFVDECVEHEPAFELRLDRGGLDENFPEWEAVLVLESELPLLEGAVVMLETGGTAGAGDFESNFPVEFPAGTTSVELPISVTVDGEDEGLEVLTVSILESMVSLEIVDRVDFEEWSGWLFEVPVEATGDQDGDGFSGLGEYLLGTDPTDVASRPGMELVVREDGLLIATGILPERDDAVLEVEVSGDLVEWETAAHVRTNEGLMVSPMEGLRFLRLSFRLLE